MDCLLLRLLKQHHKCSNSKLTLHTPFKLKQLSVLFRYAAYMGEVQPAPAPAADPYAQPVYGAAYAQPAYGHPAPQYAQQAPGPMHGGGPAQSGAC